MNELPSVCPFGFPEEINDYLSSYFSEKYGAKVIFFCNKIETVLKH
jgi:hypothetical protein